MAALTGLGSPDISTNSGPDSARESVWRWPFHLPNSVSSKVDRLWTEKNFAQLVIALEQEMDTPAGITWTPNTFHKKAPILPKPLPVLSEFARDLTLEAEQGKLRPFSGRVKEISKIAEILGRNQKSNPLLLGAPGVGKTSIPEGIAQKIVKNDVDLPATFKGKRIFLLAWERLAANAEKYSGDTLEKRLIAVLKEASENKENVILFIDEIHAFLTGGHADILKPALANGSLSCIGATTTWDYQKMIEDNPALERRFPDVNIPEPSEQDMRKVLNGVIPMLEAHHGVHITDQALEESIKLGERYLKSQSFPDKAIDLLDQAASRLSLTHVSNAKDRQLSIFLKLLIQMRNQVDDPTQLDQKIAETRSKFSRILTEDLIRNVVAEKVNLPLQRIQESEKDLLNNLEATISKKIIGQTQSITSLCQGVRRARLKLGNPERPAGVFLMLGPTGVGKTESAKVLSQILYGSRDNILRLDMSEYQHSSDINKLIGSPAGYIGHGQGGKLTNWLKKKPLSIVLLDEIEKADRSIFDLLLGVFDAGRITDGNNETIRCLDTIFIMTSNAGAKTISQNYQKLTEENLVRVLDQSLEKIFKPEFIGRIQETVIFYPLSETEVRQIVELQCTELKERVEKNVHCPNLKMGWDASLIQFLAKTYYDPARGARGISRGILRTMETPIGDSIIQEKIKPGSRIHFSSNGTKVIMKVT